MKGPPVVCTLSLQKSVGIGRRRWRRLPWPGTATRCTACCFHYSAMVSMMHSRLQTQTLSAAENGRLSDGTVRQRAANSVLTLFPNSTVPVLVPVAK
jgi:hypothetical protein